MANAAVRALGVVRNAVLAFVGLLVAWTTLSSSVDTFKKRQYANVKSGVELIRAIQSYRRPWITKLLSFWTFFGEEEFYLLMLPLLFWNVDHKLGFQATMVVCVGIFSGNFLKDMFCIPRPPEKEVWVSGHLRTADSTGLQDFGFPSTHSVNAFSNPALLIMFYVSADVLVTDAPLPLVISIIAAVVYGSILAVSRLYLGVHSPNDVRAGLFIGLVVVSLHGSVGEAFYNWTLTSPAVGAVSMSAVIALMLLCPQVRPRTPTFLQNCSLLGLILGDIIGTRWLHDGFFVDAAAEAAAPAAAALSVVTSNAVVAFFARYIVGAAIVMLTRVVLKAVVNSILNAVFGVRLFTNKGQKGAEAEESDLVVTLEAVSKATVYTALATAVTYGSPLTLHALGLRPAGLA